jgi:hypothetical protein
MPTFGQFEDGGLGLELQDANSMANPRSPSSLSWDYGEYVDRLLDENHPVDDHYWTPTDVGIQPQMLSKSYGDEEAEDWTTRIPQDQKGKWVELPSLVRILHSPFMIRVSWGHEG